MEKKLKYINLFEELSQRGIPGYHLGSIIIPKEINVLPEVYKELPIDKLEYLIIDNVNMSVISGFYNLKYIKENIFIRNNSELHTISGFDNLTKKHGWYLSIQNNPKLITLSLPSKLLKMSHHIFYEGKIDMIYNIKDFINKDMIIQDCIDKFDPGLHGDIVVTQIMENIETWGTLETQATIINHLLSKGNYLEYIPESMKHLAEEHYKHLYHPDFNNTGAKSVAKVATGITYGLF